MARNWLGYDGAMGDGRLWWDVVNAYIDGYFLGIGYLGHGGICAFWGLCQLQT